LNPSLFVQTCKDAFNISDVYARINATNQFYGGDQIVTTETFFTHGTADGWHAAGVKKTPGVYANTLDFILDGYHCSDLYFPSSGDSDSLKKVQAAHIQQIATWLNQSNSRQILSQ